MGNLGDRLIGSKSARPLRTKNNEGLTMPATILITDDDKREVVAYELNEACW